MCNVTPRPKKEDRKLMFPCHDFCIKKKSKQHGKTWQCDKIPNTSQYVIHMIKSIECDWMAAICLLVWKSSGPLPGQSAQAHQLGKIVLCREIWQRTRSARMAPVGCWNLWNGSCVKCIGNSVDSPPGNDLETRDSATPGHCGSNNSPEFSSFQHPFSLCTY